MDKQINLFDSRALQEANGCDRYIYHYTTLKSGLEHILPEGKIRFSPLKKTNDPLEYKRNAVYIFIKSNDMPFSGSDFNMNRYKYVLENYFKVASFSLDNKELLYQLSNDVNIDCGRGEDMQNQGCGHSTQIIMKVCAWYLI